ncbi:MAG: universal stress protein [Algibacter sp.]|uniref:universal stress protein n=1 Tax=Algibacter sp. TaxID=1872428 RepID=UPI00260912CB|nr:universal stress protein [Algibacter sp.]MDG1728817.1 universal stress protein [Algibacter sp.]MDG2177290.1 universal stress protein [Algibacter sp.]
MKKIIIPIDFSEHSEYALKTAAKLAKKHKAELLVLHMLEMSDIMLSASDGLQNQKAAFFLQLAEQKFNKFLDKDYLSDVKITPLIKHFKVFSEVNNIALKQDADLIVMGSHGTNGLAEFFVGSNTERVVRNANIPVLVVKNNVSDVNFDVIAFACDFSEETIKPYLNAVKMFDNVGAKVYMVHVNLPNEKFMSSLEIEKKVVNFFAKAEGSLGKLEDVQYVSDYTVEDGILNCANKIGADLIVMPTHGRKGLAHFFEGSIGEDVANHSTLPVMTFKI